MIERTCEYCKQVYRTYPSIRLRFCSHRCASAFKRKGEIAQCVQCGKDFWRYPSKNNQVYCSRSCATTARNLTAANPSYHRDISGEKNPMYGKGLKGAANPMFGKRKEFAPQWKGGRKVRKDGYVLVVAPDDHPYPADSHPPSGLKYVLEHRHVMEQHLGRFLSPQEVVHHLDSNPSNNALDNLALLPDQSTHAALHMEERWAKEHRATQDPTYLRYLWSARWQQKRRAVIERAGYKCERCGARKDKLAVHHKTYANLFDEQPEELEALCFPCHAHVTHSSR